MKINWKRNLLVIWISQFLAMIGFNLCMPFIPYLMEEKLGIIDPKIRGVCISAYYFTGMIGLCIATIVWGMLADRFGRKIMLLRASYGAALLYPLILISPNFSCMLAARFLNSLFTGTVNPAQTLLVSNTPPEKHGFVLGTLSTAVWSGTMAGYLCGGVIVDKFGYTVAFMSCTACYLIGGALVHLFVKEEFHMPLPEDTRASLKWSEVRKLLSPGVVWLMVVFIVFGVARRMEEPFIPELVKVLHPHNAASFTGYISAAAALGGILSGIVIGGLCDRFAIEKVLYPVLAACVAASLLQACANGIWMLLTARFLTYFAAGGVQPAFQIMLARITGNELRGTYFGWSNSMTNIGGIVCSAVSATMVISIGLRGVFFATSGAYLLILLLLPPTSRCCRKEEITTADR